MLSKKPHIILMIGDDGVAVAPNHIINAVPFFAANDARRGAQEIMDFIARQPGAGITLVADNLAQDYRTDVIPRLNFLDRRKVLQRRMKQHFPQARLTACLPCRHNPERALIIGLHESNPVFAWAEKLRARLPQICLLPVEGARIAMRLMPDDAEGWAMLISRQKTGGFRQIVTHRGDLAFTRLTPLPPKDSKLDEAEIIARDIKASLDYLGRQGLQQAGDLSVLLLLSDDVHEDEAFDTLGLGSIRSLSPLHAAQQLNLPIAPTEQDDTADLLFATHLAMQFRPALPLMLPAMREIWLEKKTQHWGWRAAIACMALVLASLLWRAGDLGLSLYNTQKQMLQLQASRRELSALKASAAPETEPLGRLRAALERRHIYGQPAPSPWQCINELSGGMGEGADLTALDWKKDNDTAPDNLNVRLRLAGPVTDRAEAVDRFTQLAQNIARAMPDYRVTDTKPPFPALPQDTVTAEKDNGEAIGELTLQRKQP